MIKTIINQFLERIKEKSAYTISYVFPQRRDIIRKINDIRKNIGLNMDNNDAKNIYMAVKAVNKIDGIMVEVGVYKGGSAKIICKAKGNKTLYLFDTFSGLPKPSKEKNNLQEGQYKASYEVVFKNLIGCKNIHLVKGIFPQTSIPIKENKFCFVHIDTDLYKSILDCLDFFYPRMSKGGIILIHDYINLDGVRKAVDGFFKDKSEPVMEISNTQCMIMRLE